MQNTFFVHFFAFRFRFFFASQDASSYATSRQNNLELYLGCHTC